MNICNHIIQKSQIVGISPLMKNSSQELIRATVQLWFWVHLKTQSIKIESEWLQLGDASTVDPYYLGQRRKYNEFEIQFNHAHAEIKALVEAA